MSKKWELGEHRALDCFSLFLYRIFFKNILKYSLFVMFQVYRKVIEFYTHTHTHTQILVAVVVSLLSCFQLFVTPRTVAHQGPLSMELPSKNTGVGSHSLLQGIVLTQGLNPGLLHCRLILYHLSQEGRPQRSVGSVNPCQM